MRQLFKLARSRTADAKAADTITNCTLTKYEQSQGHAGAQVKVTPALVARITPDLEKVFFTTAVSTHSSAKAFNQAFSAAAVPVLTRDLAH